MWRWSPTTTLIVMHLLEDGQNVKKRKRLTVRNICETVHCRLHTVAERYVTIARTIVRVVIRFSTLFCQYRASLIHINWEWLTHTETVKQAFLKKARANKMFITRRPSMSTIDSDKLSPEFDHSKPADHKNLLCSLTTRALTLLMKCTISSFSSPQLFALSAICEASNESDEIFYADLLIKELWKHSVHFFDIENLLCLAMVYIWKRNTGINFTDEEELHDIGYPENSNVHQLRIFWVEQKWRYIRFGELCHE